MKSKILVTGATGFIGSNVVRRLVNNDIDIGIIKRQNSDLWRIKDLIDKIHVYDTPLEKTEDVLKTISEFEPDIIFHLATNYSPDHKPQDIPLMVNTNILGTGNLLEASKEYGVKLFVNTSSCFVYKSIREKIKEDSRLDPFNLYAMTKIQAENACNFYAEKYGLDIVTFRLFPPYGPYDNEKKLIPYLIRTILAKEHLKMTSGKQQWDFIYVDDIVDAYMKLITMPKLPNKHEIFNIGTGHSTSIRDITNLVSSLIGNKVKPAWGAIPHRKNEIWHMCADIDKADKHLKWRPKISIAEGLKFTIDWHKGFRKR